MAGIKYDYIYDLAHQTFKIEYKLDIFTEEERQEIFDGYLCEFDMQSEEMQKKLCEKAKELLEDKETTIYDLYELFNI